MSYPTTHYNHPPQPTRQLHGASVGQSLVASFSHCGEWGPARSRTAPPLIHAHGAVSVLLSFFIGLTHSGGHDLERGAVGVDHASVCDVPPGWAGPGEGRLAVAVALPGRAVDRLGPHLESLTVAGHLQACQSVS